MNSASIKRILIVKLHALGDLVIVTPAIRRLREAFPDAQIDLLTTEYSAPAAMNNPHIDELIIVPNDVFFSPSSGTVLPTLKLIGQLRANGYDAAILFHKHRAVRLFVKSVGIGRIYCFGGESEFTIPLDEVRHSVATACDLADHAIFGLTGEKKQPAYIGDLRLEWFPAAEESKYASDFLKDKGLKRGEFVIFYAGGGENPGHSGHDRRWKLENFVELQKLIRLEYGLPVVLMGGKSDIATSEKIMSSVGDGLFNWTSKLSLRHSAAISANASVVVTNDSGPLHFSAAVGTPCVGLFGPTGASRKMPPGERHVAVQAALPCSPCYFGSFQGCLFETIKCMDQITVDLVFQAIKRILSETGTGH